ncbi:MAG: hypothetical protein K0R02_405 [Rickettsiaceae bacterium]|jgi:hypothetical protein|nr:hypothetical protein [Rickettsiaceae bacterium]
MKRKAVDDLETSIVSLLNTKMAKDKAEEEKGLYPPIKRNDFDEVKKLIDQKVNVNITAKDQLTPLHHACINGNIKIIKILLKAGADINAQDYEGYRPLDFAYNNKKLEAVKFLYSFGALPKICFFTFQKLYTVIDALWEPFSIEKFNINFFNDKFLEFTRGAISADEKKVIISRINNAQNENIKQFINHLYKIYNEGMIGKDLYETIILKCPKIVKYCIETIKPYYLSLKRGVELSNESGILLNYKLPHEIITHIASYLSPTGKCYKGYSDLTGIKSGINDDLYSFEYESNIEDATVSLSGDHELRGED